MLSLKTAFSLSSFTLIKRLFSSSSLSAIGVVLSAGDLGLIPDLGRPSGEGKGYPLQCSGLENSTDCIVQGVAKSWTQLREFHLGNLGSSLGQEDPLEKGMTTHSSISAWRIPWTV